MREKIKKYIIGLFEKWFLGLLTSLIILFGSAIAGSVKVFINMPDELQQMKEDRKRDSTFVVNYMITDRIEKDSLKRVINHQAKWIDQDYKDIQIIKTKLKLK